MKKFVGIIFQNKDDVSYFFVEKIRPKKNVTVIVQTDQGLRFGKVVTKIMDGNFSSKKVCGKIVRISTRNDYYTHLRNIKEEGQALDNCKKLVKRMNLAMQIVDATYTFDRSQLLFRFVADSRVDFRQFAKELAKIYKTRIELHQIGIRDKAKEVGGLGLCGAQLCCARFLKEFNSVSISMAKNQNISLNPSKINGVCGRLLCCLKYEDDVYTHCKECLPKLGQVIQVEQGTGKVIDVDILNKKYKVEIKDIGVVEVMGDCSKKHGSHK